MTQALACPPRFMPMSTNPGLGFGSQWGVKDPEVACPKVRWRGEMDRHFRCEQDTEDVRFEKKGKGPWAWN